jgi:hypothetical protein
MKTTDYRSRVALAVLGIVVVVLVLGFPLLWGGAIGTLAAVLADTHGSSEAWLLGAVGLLALVAVVGLGALIGRGAWRH